MPRAGEQQEQRDEKNAVEDAIQQAVLPATGDVVGSMVVHKQVPPDAEVRSASVRHIQHIMLHLSLNKSIVQVSCAMLAHAYL